MQFQTLLGKLNTLNLPQDEYVLVGSAPLAIRKIREAGDLDVITSERLWSLLAKDYPITTEYGVNKIVLYEGTDILGKGSMYQNPTIASVEEMIQTADIIKGHRFLNLELLKKFKAKHGRDKDLKDIELIDQYLAQQNK